MSSLPAPNTWLPMLKKRTILSVCFESVNVLRQKCKVLFIPIIFCSFCNNPTQVNIMYCSVMRVLFRYHSTRYSFVAFEHKKIYSKILPNILV